MAARVQGQMEGKVSLPEAFFLRVSIRFCTRHGLSRDEHTVGLIQVNGVK